VDDARRFGKVGVVGYCFGGLLAWLAASELSGVAASCAYYGGGIAGQLDRHPNCPVMMHFGDKDAHIPLTDVEKVRKAHPDVTIHVYEADHGFNCDHRASYDAAAAKLARTRTLEFFASYVG
jgi:carboxymethylenebutenolidase